MIDLNSTSMLSDRIGALIDAQIEAQPQEKRTYLGMSVAGHECERNTQYQLLSVKDEIPRQIFGAQTLRRFDRGHVYEDRARKWLQAAGFVFVPTPPEVTDFEGRFKGHVDGIIAGFFPGDSPVKLPALWECKCLDNKTAKAIEKDGLKKASPGYHSQVQLYMHYLELPRCLYTVVNADTMELMHYIVNYDKSAAEAVISKVGRVFTATDMGELLPRCTSEKEYYLCKMCTFNTICWK